MRNDGAIDCQGHSVLRFFRFPRPIEGEARSALRPRSGAREGQGEGRKGKLHDPVDCCGYCERFLGSPEAQPRHSDFRWREVAPRREAGSLPTARAA
jgi:hypothetical protein